MNNQKDLIFIRRQFSKSTIGGNEMKRRFSQKVLSVFLCVALIMTCLPFSFLASAAEYNYEGGAGIKISDLDTSTKFSESLGDNASTEFAGRIWSDKSVYTDDATFDIFGGGTSTILLNEKNNGEDFLVAYSALATSESISGSTQAPVDVVLIIDISGSMSNAESNMDNRKSRIYNTVQATNNAIDELMKLNPYTRVAVVAFSSNAQVLLPLDRYTKTTTTEREWVSTGIFSGYWKEEEVTVPYFTLSAETGSDNYAVLYTKALNSDGDPISKETDVEGGTNIQIGLYEGMQVLAEETETKANINGQLVKRVPSVILLSDGSPTYSSNSRSWWAPADNYNDGPGSAPYAGNGMKAILVGSYMKDAIDRNYDVANTSFATTVYTIGMGITGLETDEKNLAYMTLDPGTYWNNNNVTNSMKTTIKNYWNTYTSRNNTGTLNINVGKYEDRRYYDKNYALTHPNTGYDVNPTNGYDYVDDYYDADNASAVTSVFNEIVANISVSAPQVPTEIKGDDPTTGGKIIYTDPIGDYMEVKDVKAIIYAGQTFNVKNTVVNGNVTTYVFEGSVHSVIYGDQSIDDIIITVTDNNGKQTLVVEIPASVIPIRLNEVQLNPDGTVKTHTNNGAMPARVVYSVGLQSEILKKADDGTVYVDKTKLSDAYLNDNTNSDGTINFYSNEYTNPHLINGSTVGDATIEFEPAHTNGFYYILEDMPIYKDKNFEHQVTVNEGIDDDTVYYYKDEYYHGNSTEIDAVERTGTQLKKTEIVEGADGYLYRATGSPRLNRILKFEGTKLYNNTNTAEDFYAPEFHYAEGSTSAYDGKFIVHLGNNGLLTLTAGGDLQISKTVNAADGLTAPDKRFEFNIDLDGDDVNGGEYNYVVLNASNTPVSTGTLSASNTKIYLKDGETATIFSLPPGTDYVVTETQVAGFTSSATGDTGTIAAAQTRVASFTNTYNVNSVAWGTNDELKGAKELLGREWTGDDSFTFFISPYNNAPLPVDYNADEGVTVDKPDTVGGNTASFNFGEIEFTAPGVYRYTIFEKEPENDEYLPGMSYSRALYRVVVTVVDNGDGTLSVSDSDIQKLYNDDAEQLFEYNNGQIVMNDGQESEDAIKFINTYAVGEVIRVPVALKDYTDNSGQKPLVSGMFEFKLEALGIVENGKIVDKDVSKVPMPEGTVDGVAYTYNEGHNITFPSVTFKQSDIIDGDSITFRYRMSEVVPNNPVNGMEYDSTVYTVDVVVSVDAKDNVLNVSAIYPNDEYIVTFKNEYTPKSITTDIKGTKTLVGRDMKQGEFEFVLGSNAATGNAIRQGTVVVPSSSQTVAGAENGVASTFAFENIEFKKAGTYVFTISETKGNAASVQYDDSVITVEIVIDDTNDDGNLEVVSKTYSGGGNSADFTNTYTSTFTGTPVSLMGTKTLTGKTLLAGEFYFSVEEYFNGVKTGSRLVTHEEDISLNNGVYNGNIVLLNEVTYDKAGTYQYVITEQIPDNKVEGTTYDTSKFRYTVVVEDDLNGNLTVTSKKPEKASDNGWVNVETIEFTNKYVPKPTTAVLPLIKKVLDGDRSEQLKAGEFEFELKLVSADEQDGVILPSDTIVTNEANGDIIFDKITFTKAGTYTLSVQEIIPDDANKVPGVTYSTQTITAVYTVHDDRNGVLTATLTKLIGGENIINEYAADSANVTIDITKTFTGRKSNEWLSTDKFDFKVKVTDTDTLNAIENGDIEFTFDANSTDTATYTISAKGDKATANVKVNKPGTYKFVVTEVDGGIAGVTYDTNAKEIVIVATDDSANAKIKVKVNEVDNNKATVNFTNTYAITGQDSVLINGTKILNGDRTTVKAGEFSFGLYDQNGELVKDASGAPYIVTNNANGGFTFPSLDFSEADVGADGISIYTYTVKEIAGNNARYTYDSTAYTVKITVKDDNEGGIDVTREITNAGNPAQIVFTNTYTNPVAVSYTPLAKKLYNKTLLGGDFKFKLEGNIGTTPISQEKTNTADGTITFDTLMFPEAGTYRFTVKEIDKVFGFIEYSTAEYELLVNVIDTNGVLSLGSVTVNNAPNGSIEFTNTYVIDGEDEITLRGTKTLTGGRTTFAAGEFEFGLYDAAGGLIETVKNDADGNFAFTTLKFDETDVPVSSSKQITYTVKEIVGSDKRITYDDTIYTVVVTVEDDNEGGVKASYTVDNAPNGLITFTNIYTPKPDDIAVDIDIIKTVVNKGSEKIGPKGFKFLLNALADGVADRTVTTDENGSAKFTLNFTEDDIGNTYTYKLTEVNDGEENVTYSNAEYTITVAISLNVNNELIATITKNGEPVTQVEAEFENIYDYTPEVPESPQTGDNSNLQLWFVLLFVSGGGIITTTFCRRKKKEEN